MTVLTREQIAGLSSQEKLDLIDQLWESLEPADSPLTDALRRELDRRITRFGAAQAGGS